MTWGRESASWDEIAERAESQSRALVPGASYLVDPTAGIRSLVDLLSVALVPSATVLWVKSGVLDTDLSASASGPRSIAFNCPREDDRPLWGIATSGTTSSPKIAMGYSDMWDAIAMMYEEAIYRPAFASREMGLATNLPLQFSAAFFMVVLPAMLYRRDLTIVPPTDLGSLAAAQERSEQLVLSAPSIMAAACHATGAAHLDESLLVLGGGHLGQGRVDFLRDRLGVRGVWNIYGTAETGCISIDPEPGHGDHVGRPVRGKRVWIEGQGTGSVGRVCVSGPDCASYIWRAGTVEAAARPAGADLGRLDEQGNVVLEGRADGGEKLNGRLIFPREIERHLLTLPGVHDVRVSVLQRANGLEGLSAVVVGTATADDVRQLKMPDGVVLNEVRCLSEQAAVAAYTDHGKLTVGGGHG